MVVRFQGLGEDVFEHSVWEEILMIKRTSKHFVADTWRRKRR